MNKEQKEYFSKVKKKYKIKAGRHYTCPICGLEGKPQEGNHLVMEHTVIGSKGIAKHRWSFASGRVVELQAEETNVL